MVHLVLSFWLNFILQRAGTCSDFGYLKPTILDQQDPGDQTNNISEALDFRSRLVLVFPLFISLFIFLTIPQRLHLKTPSTFSSTCIVSTKLTTIMNSRITRSSARQAASQAAQTNAIAPAAADVPTTATSTTPASRKRKGLATEKSPSSALTSGSSGRRSKRQKIPEAVSPSTNNKNHQPAPRARRKAKHTEEMDSPE